ncbi:hypothetical protein Trydic_g2756 [Trypoxylus dichotomus]
MKVHHTMDSNRLSNDEYELQYYEFSSTGFIIQFKKLILETITEDINDLETQVVLNLPEDLISPFRTQCAALRTQFEKGALAELEKVEEDIRSYFAIPSHVLLPKDVDNVPCPRPVIDTLECEIKQLELEYAKKRGLKYLLEKEVELVNNLEKSFTDAMKINKEMQCYQKLCKSNLITAKIHKDLSKKLVLMGSKHKHLISSDLCRMSSI